MTLDEATVLIIYPSPSWRDRSALLPRLVGYIGSILPLGMKRIPRMYPFFGRSTRNFREPDTGEVVRRIHLLGTRVNIRIGGGTRTVGIP
jgi:hypothetical protein